MNKKIYSFIIISFTVIYVAINLSCNNIELINAIGKTSLEKFHEFTNFKRAGNSNGSTKVVYDEVKQTEEISVKKDYLNSKKENEAVKDNKTAGKSNTTIKGNIIVNHSVVSKQALSEKTDEGIFYDKDLEDSALLNDLDREKLKYEARKLAAADQNKVLSLVEAGDKESIKRAIIILNERLSDKEFDNIRAISLKFNKK